MKNGDVTLTNFSNRLDQSIEKKDVDTLYSALNRLEQLMNNVDNCGNCAASTLCQMASCQSNINCTCQRCQTCQVNCSCQSLGALSCQSMEDRPNCNCCGSDASA